MSSSSSTTSSPFFSLSDDIILNILAKLESDPRDWARLSCVSTRLSLLIRSVCFRSRCSRQLPSDLLLSPPPPSFPSLHKLSVCCPGLLRAGILLENSDFGLERDIGPHLLPSPNPHSIIPIPPPSNPTTTTTTTTAPNSLENLDSCWSLFDDLYFDTVYDRSESDSPIPPPPIQTTASIIPPSSESSSSSSSSSISIRKRRKKKASPGPIGAHLATGPWTLSREQGNKLLASRFRGDCLYICDWPGCVHAEEKRKYMLFRGVFKNFKRSKVWKSIVDLNREKIQLDCAFCACKETWDLHSAFCLRRVFGFHDDGEPVVRAYVCENGHVSGAWTERPMYA